MCQQKSQGVQINGGHDKNVENGEEAKQVKEEEPGWIINRLKKMENHGNTEKKKKKESHGVYSTRLRGCIPITF